MQQGEAPIDSEGERESIPFHPGQTVDRYELVSRIGAGGMGVVFEAVHSELRSRVALKFVRLDKEDRTDYAQRLNREALLASRLQHENVVSILDVGNHDGRVFLALEYIDGTTLGHVLEDFGPLPHERACELLVQTCRGVQAAHEAGIVHRDLKTSNLMLMRRADGSDLVKILDFGIARAEANPDESDITLTASGAVLGTPHYMAPEVARGESRGSVQADVYALGVVLFELLSGERPFAGESYNAVLYKVSGGDPRNLAELCPLLPEQLVALVHRTMAAAPDERPQSAEELLNALLPYSQPQLPVTIPPVSGMRPPPQQRAKRRSRRRVVLALVGAALLATGYLVGTTRGTAPAETSSEPDVAPAAPATTPAVPAEAQAAPAETPSSSPPPAKTAAQSKEAAPAATEVPAATPTEQTAEKPKATAPRAPSAHQRPTKKGSASTQPPSSQLDEKTGLEATNPYQ